MSPSSCCCFPSKLSFSKQQYLSKFSTFLQISESLFSLPPILYLQKGNSSGSDHLFVYIQGSLSVFIFWLCGQLFSPLCYFFPSYSFVFCCTLEIGPWIFPVSFCALSGPAVLSSRLKSKPLLSTCSSLWHLFLPSSGPHDFLSKNCIVSKHFLPYTSLVIIIL